MVCSNTQNKFSFCGEVFFLFSIEFAMVTLVILSTKVMKNFYPMQQQQQQQNIQNTFFIDVSFFLVYFSFHNFFCVNDSERRWINLKEKSLFQKQCLKVEGRKNFTITESIKFIITANYLQNRTFMWHGLQVTQYVIWFNSLNTTF